MPCCCCHLLGDPLFHYVHWRWAESSLLHRKNQLLAHYTQALISLMTPRWVTCPTPRPLRGSPSFHLQGFFSPLWVFTHRHSLDIVITCNAAPSKLLIQALLCSTVTSRSLRERCAKRRIMGTLASLALPVLCCLLTQQPFPSYSA